MTEAQWMVAQIAFVLAMYVSFVPALAFVQSLGPFRVPRLWPSRRELRELEVARLLFENGCELHHAEGENLWLVEEDLALGHLDLRGGKEAR